MMMVITLDPSRIEQKKCTSDERDQAVIDAMEYMKNCGYLPMGLAPIYHEKSIFDPEPIILGTVEMVES